MNSRLRWIAVLALAAAVLMAGTWNLFATQKPNPAGKSPPGWEAAQTISTITGVAISPLLGVGAVGAYKYYKTAPEKRGSLAWYAQPWFFYPALLLVLIVVAKDLIGTVAPTVLKKPFDVAEAVENKVSGLVAVGAFIPLVVSVFPTAPGAGGELNAAELGFAAISAGGIGNALLTPFAMVAFAFVWLASHAVNMLILLSPFTLVDSALKSFRLLLLSVLTGAALANPYLGAALGLVIIVVSYFISGWSFRLTVFGTIYVWDFITFRRVRFQPGAESNKMFTATKFQGAPVRSYGKLIHLPDGKLRFEYRPWLVLKGRSFDLPDGHYVIGRGLFYPEIDRVEEDKSKAVFILPPRFMTHEEALARAYGFPEVRDVGILKGLTAMWNWLKGLVGAGEKRETPAAVPA